jgi:5-methylcytosine-specific restriction endonuclease McrA
MIKPNITDFDASKFKLGSLCKREHDYEGTGMSLRRKNGSTCHECSREYQKEYYKENKEYCSEYNKKYHEANKEYWKDYHEKNKEKNKEQKRRHQKRYHEANKEYYSEYNKKYREANKERERERVKAWRVANPDKTRSQKQKRLARIKRQSDGSVTTEQILDLLESTTKCVYCSKEITGKNKTVDHMIPLSRGGLNSMRNLAVCCAYCNRYKFNKSYPEWLDCLDPKQRKSAERLYYKRYGVSPLQGHLPLIFETEDKSDD